MSFIDTFSDYSVCSLYSIVVQFVMARGVKFVGRTRALLHDSQSWTTVGFEQFAEYPHYYNIIPVIHSTRTCWISTRKPCRRRKVTYINIMYIGGCQRGIYRSLVGGEFLLGFRRGSIYVILTLKRKIRNTDYMLNNGPWLFCNC